MNYLDFYPSVLQENRKQAKELVVQGKLSPEEFELLQTIDKPNVEPENGVEWTEVSLSLADCSTGG